MNNFCFELITTDLQFSTDFLHTIFFTILCNFYWICTLWRKNLFKKLATSNIIRLFTKQRKMEHYLSHNFFFRKDLNALLSTNNNKPHFILLQSMDILK